MVNLDFSGLFGNGGFAIEPSRFNFDAYKVPERKKEPVVDPVDVVSNRTPTPEVEVLEGAGTVAVTKPDPITQAIESLRGKDLTQSLNVNPIIPTTKATSAPTVSIKEAVNNLDFKQAIEEPVETFEPIQESVGPSNIIQAVEQVKQPPKKPVDYSGTTWKDLEKQRLEGGAFSLDKAFVAQDQAAREADLSDQGLMFEAGLGEDLRQDYNPNDQFTTGAMGEVLRSGNQADFKNLVDQGTVNRLAELGLKADYKQDKYKGYRYNPETGAYDYYDNTPSKLEQAVPALIKAGVMTAATAGLASGLSTATGMGAGMSTGLTTGGMTLAQGGSVEEALINGITAGLGAEAKDLNNAVKAGTATKETIATANLINNIDDVGKLVKAVDSGNVLGVVTNGLSLAGVGSIEDVVGDGIKAVAGDSGFIADNIDPVTKAVTKVVTSGIKGDSIEEVVAKGLYEYVKNGGALPNIDLDLGGGWDTPEWLSAIDDEVLQPIKDSIVAGYQYVNETVLEPAVESIDQFVRTMPTTKEDWQAAEDYVNENIVDPTAKAVRETGRDIEEAYGEAEDFVKEDIAPAVREAGRDVREAVAPVTTAVRETGRAIEEGYDTVEDFVKEDVAPVVREFGRDIRGLLPDGGLDFEFPDFSGLSGEIPGVYSYSTSGGNADNSALAKLKTQFGEQYQFEDLRNNPLLKNELFA